MDNNTPVSLVSKWFPQPEYFTTLLPALQALASAVAANEPDTLTYLVHVPNGDASLVSFPPIPPVAILFFETYRNADAFRAHVKGPTFTRFITDYGHMFLESNGAPYTTVEFLDRAAGFVRPPEVEQ